MYTSTQSKPKSISVQNLLGLPNLVAIELDSNPINLTQMELLDFAINLMNFSGGELSYHLFTGSYRGCFRIRKLPLRSGLVYRVSIKPNFWKGQKPLLLMPAPYARELAKQVLERVPCALA